MEVIIGKTRLTLIQGDITQQGTQAIVNAANQGLRGGGGVDGAIHRAGGPEIMQECNKIRAQQGGCPTGSAVITTGGRLKAKWVIHAVGPIWRKGKQKEAELLAKAYRSSLSLALERGIKSISFPSISTGAYGYPVDKAAKVALKEVTNFIKENPDKLSEVIFVLFDSQTYNIYVEALKGLKESGE
jgi:O-acetyl-ADP-ribose deacetylase (regulator of RNase III)